MKEPNVWLLVDLFNADGMQVEPGVAASVQIASEGFYATLDLCVQIRRRSLQNFMAVDPRSDFAIQHWQRGVNANTDALQQAVSQIGRLQLKSNGAKNL